MFHDIDELKDPLKLIKVLAAGDKSALSDIYHVFGSIVYNTAISYVQNTEDAEEITQDVFTKVYQNASKFKGDSKVGTWIYRITVNCSLNQIQKQKRRASKNLDDVNREQVDFSHPGVLLENRENSKILFDVIDTLPDSQKTAFILSFIEELPRQEVADVMKLSLKATESLLQRAKGNLRKKLEKRYPHRRKK